MFNCLIMLLQRWARAFRENQYHAAVETNNGTEAQNKALKYKYLPRKAVSLSNVVSIIIEQFLPEQHRKYLFLNFQMDPTYRAYTTHVPSYLQGRPRNVIIHCLEREERARHYHPQTSRMWTVKMGSFLFVINQGTYTQ